MLPIFTGWTTFCRHKALKFDPIMNCNWFSCTKTENKWPHGSLFVCRTFLSQTKRPAHFNYNNANDMFKYRSPIWFLFHKHRKWFDIRYTDFWNFYQYQSEYGSEIQKKWHCWDVIGFFFINKHLTLFWSFVIQFFPSLFLKLTV